MRRLTAGEIALAQGVFGASIKLQSVRVAYAPLGFGLTLGRVILFPPDAPRDFATAPLHLRAWLIHELVHVWQFQTAPLKTLRSWAGVVASGGYGVGSPGYAYSRPFTWAALNLEQQAMVVQDLFTARETGAKLTSASGATPFFTRDLVDA